MKIIFLLQQGCSSATAAPESNGCWSWGSKRGKSQGTAASLTLFLSWVLCSILYLQVIAAEGEKNAAVSLRSAADVITGNPAAIQLRYLQVIIWLLKEYPLTDVFLYKHCQTLSSISAEKNSTIIFPVPMDIINAFSRKWRFLSLLCCLIATNDD